MRWHPAMPVLPSRHLLTALACASGLFAAEARAQLSGDPSRGASLYLGLPGGEPSCVECHGPDPGQNRNRLLFAAQGPAAISLAITKAAPMGYLRELLSEADRADLSAYLAQVNNQAQDEAETVVWPWGLEFGRMQPGQTQEQSARLFNRGMTPLPLSPMLQSWPGTVGGLAMTHDCPSSLPSGESCMATVRVLAGAPGRVQASVRWQDDAGSALAPVGVSAQVTDGSAALGLAALAGAQPPALQLRASPGVVVVVEHEMVNLGSAAFTLGTPAITGPGQTAFTLAGSACSTGLSLAPQARCTLRISAVAPAAGTATALLQWRNDAGHLAPVVLAVQADGDLVPSPPPAPLPPPAPSPAPPVSPAPPAPAPAPPPTPELAGGGGGGCSVALDPRRTDPLLPALLMAALLALSLRRRASGGARAR
jgi:cytochrome c553